VPTIAIGRAKYHSIPIIYNYFLEAQGGWSFVNGVLSANSQARLISIPVQISESPNGFIAWIGDTINPMVFPQAVGLGATPSIASGNTWSIPAWTAIIGRHTRGSGYNSGISIHALFYNDQNNVDQLLPTDIILMLANATGQLMFGNGQVIGGNVQLKAGCLSPWSGNANQLVQGDGSLLSAYGNTFANKIFNAGQSAGHTNPSYFVVEKDDSTGYTWCAKGDLKSAISTNIHANLESTTAANPLNGNIGVTGTLGIDNGGTGANNSPDAARNLFPSNLDSSNNYNVGINRVTGYAGNPGNSRQVAGDITISDLKKKLNEYNYSIIYNQVPAYYLTTNLTWFVGAWEGGHASHPLSSESDAYNSSRDIVGICFRVFGKYILIYSGTTSCGSHVMSLKSLISEDGMPGSF